MISYPLKLEGKKMRRIVKSFFGESVRTKRDPYMNVGFKAYENTCCDDARTCNCSKRSHERKMKKNAAPKRDGLF